MAYFVIQLNADSLYTFACWSLCLLCLLILMLIILMLILIESRSMLIVYWFGNRKLINAYLTKNNIQNINFPKEFWKFKFIYCKIYINVLKYRCLYLIIQICQLGNAMNANEVYLWMRMRKCLLAMLILMLVILMLILMPLNMNTGYADTNADFCIRFMSLWCISLFI